MQDEKLGELKSKEDLESSSEAGASQSSGVEEATSTSESEEVSGRLDSLTGKTVGKHYEIISVIGEGGLGVVYKARHMLVGTMVAVKFLLPGKHPDKKALMRFQREAQATMGLKHPAIAAMQEFGVHDDAVPYLVMEYVEGESLSSILDREGALEPKRAMSIFKQAAEALSFAHKKKIVHRDIKPANIIVSKNREGEEEIKIIDFGIAKIYGQECGEESFNLTQTGEVFGTPKYMSPEQCQGKPADFSSDMYSLGCVAFEMFSGRPPFSGSQALEVIMRHINDAPPSLKPVKGMRGLERVIAITLAKEPANRYQSLDELLIDLALIENGKQPSSRRYALGQTGVKKLMLTAILSLCCVLVGYCWFLMTFQSGTIQSASQAIERNPRDFDAYYYRARIYRKMGEERAAVSDLTKAIEINPGFFLGYKNRSELYTELGEYERALADANKAISVEPKNYRGYMARAMAEVKLEKDKEAIDDLSRGLQLNKDLDLKIWDNRMISYIHRGGAYLRLGRYDKARSDFDMACQRLPDPATYKKVDGFDETRENLIVAYVGRSEANWGLSSFADARADADIALGLDPKNVEALAARARAYIALNMYEKARADLEEAMDIAPEDKSLKKLMETISK